MRKVDHARSRPLRHRTLAVLALCATLALLCGGSAPSAAEQSAPVAIGGSEQGTTVPIGPPAGSTGPEATTTPAPTTTRAPTTTPAPTRTAPAGTTGSKAPAARTP